MHSPSQFLIIFLGAPGSGKGTQSILISEAFQFSRIEMSKLLQRRFREAKHGEYVEVAGKRYSIEEQKKRSDAGILCEDAFVAYVLQERIQKLYDEGETIVLDGFPRSIGQMEAFLPFMEEMYQKDKVLLIFLDISEQEIAKRNSTRRICELMRHPVLSVEETKNLSICPLDGSRLIQRGDDDPEVQKTRIREFQTKTLPLLQYVKDRGIQAHAVQGEQSVADVFQDVSAIVRQNT